VRYLHPGRQAELKAELFVGMKGEKDGGGGHTFRERSVCELGG
jgi:hypothetical protein